MRSCRASDHAAIGADDLAVDPAAVASGEEGDDCSDVVGLAEAAERVHGGNGAHLLLALALEEEPGLDRSGRDGIDGDAPAAELLGEDMTFGNPDFVLYAKAYGAKGHRIESIDGFAPTLDAAFKEGGVHLVVIPIDYSENMRVLVDELRAR